MAHLTAGNAAEIIGKVQEDLTVKCFQATDFGTNFGELGCFFLWLCGRRSDLLILVLGVRLCGC